MYEQKKLIPRLDLDWLGDCCNGSSRAPEVDGDKADGPLALANTQDTEDGAEVTVASWAGAYDSIVSPTTNNDINSSNKSSLVTN